MCTTSSRLNLPPRLCASVLLAVYPPPGRANGALCAAHARAMETSHTIVLIQYNLQSSSRTYLDYEGLHRALDGAHLLPAAAARGLNLKR